MRFVKSSIVKAYFTEGCKLKFAHIFFVFSVRCG